MNHSCRKQAGVPSVTVRPDMFGFVQGGPADSSIRGSRRDADDSSVLSCRAAPVEWSRRMKSFFFCFFSLSEVPSSRPLISIFSFTERPGGNRGTDFRRVMWPESSELFTVWMLAAVWRPGTWRLQGSTDTTWWTQPSSFYFLLNGLQKACLNTTLSLHQILIRLVETACFGLWKKDMQRQQGLSKDVDIPLEKI